MNLLEPSIEIYLLRHEERHKEIQFDSSLNENGKGRAQTSLVSDLEKIEKDVGEFDVIYCSPFLRTLQTIAPFCRKNKRKVITSWGLCEYLASSRHYESERMQYKLHEGKFEDIVGEHDEGVYPRCRMELIETLGYRLAHFLENVHARHAKSGTSPQRILVISHQTPIEYLYYCCNPTDESTKPLPFDSSEKEVKFMWYPMGVVTKVLQTGAVLSKGNDRRTTAYRELWHPLREKCINEHH